MADLQRRPDTPDGITEEERVAEEAAWIRQQELDHDALAGHVETQWGTLYRPPGEGRAPIVTPWLDEQNARLYAAHRGIQVVSRTIAYGDWTVERG